MVAYATVRYSKTCVTHKRNLKINWKFGIASIELRHKNIMLGLQNGPLISRPNY